MDARSEKALERENAELRERLDAVLRFDGLTGLLSKASFCKAVSGALEEPSAVGRMIVCFDICRFKLVNDLYGLEEGDVLLRAFAAALEGCFPCSSGALVGRLSGDLFAVFAPDAPNEDVRAALDAVCAACPERFGLTAVAGIYRIDNLSLPVALMCDRAIMALRTVKDSYFGRLAVYEPQLRDRLVDERAVLDGIEAALASDQIEPFFQPKCNIRTGKIVGAEALVRWRHPVKGLIQPSRFVPLLERNGFIRALDVRVWEKTAAWIAELSASGIDPVPVSVNVSRADIEGMDVRATLEGIVDRFGIDPSLLEVEITESAYVEQGDRVVEASDSLMAGGFTVLMDDFGSGYSSLNMLKDINVNVLKIDMRFLDRTDRRSRDIMESVVHMARWLGLPVVAEGVETDDQVRFLLDVGCSFAQGFRFYRPMDAVSFAGLLADEGNVERVDMCARFSADEEALFDFKDLLHEDAISDRMLGNILGAVALYSFENGVLRVLRGNAAYRRLVDWEPGEGDDSPDVAARVHPDDRAMLAEAVDRVRRNHDDEGAEVVVRRISRGGVQWLSLRLFHLYVSGDGEVLYGDIADVTERMRDVEALRMSERRFEVAMEATGLMVFELDLITRTARYSEYAQRAFGLDATVANAPEGFIEQGSVDESSTDDFRAVYEAMYRGEQRASTVVRAYLGDGSCVWNRITLMAVADAAGKATKAVGLVENVTREKEMELSLAQMVLARLNEDNQRALIGVVGDEATSGVFGRYLESDFPLYFASVDFIALLGYGTYTEFLERTGGLTRGTVAPEDAGRIEPIMLRHVPGDAYEEHYHLVRKDGSRLFVHDRGRIVWAEDGRPASVGICSIEPEPAPKGTAG